MTFVVVLFGWIFSVCLHEFAHALVAYWGGDTSVKDKGYLSLNPIKYADPIYSFALPVLFLVAGGIGLPGGAVYVDCNRLRSRAWQSAMSLAGPAANALLAVVIGLVLQYTDLGDGAWGPALSFLGLLQVSSVILNLLPVPMLDGFRAIEPWLPYDIREQAYRLGSNGVFFVMLALWYVRPLNAALWGAAYAAAFAIGIPLDQAFDGFGQFRFWKL
jgi:Zn-dependent protease